MARPKKRRRPAPRLRVSERVERRRQEAEAWERERARWEAEAPKREAEAAERRRQWEQTPLEPLEADLVVAVRSGDLEAIRRTHEAYWEDAITPDAACADLSCREDPDQEGLLRFGSVHICTYITEEELAECRADGSVVFDSIEWAELELPDSDRRAWWAIQAVQDEASEKLTPW